MANEIVDQTNILLSVGTNEMEILEFYVNDRDPETGEVKPIYFGMNVAKVMQVIERPEIRDKEHGQHPSFLGTIPLREKILPLIDLSTWLNLDVERGDDEVVIVTEFSKSVTGFVVSGVTEIHRVGWDHVKPPGTYLSNVVTASIIGTVELEDRLLQLLDMETILADLDPATMHSDYSSTVKASKQYPVLVADDSPTIRAMIDRNLKNANLLPTIANNGQEAFEKLLALKAKAEQEGKDIFELVRIVISDIEMPSMDGFTLTKNIKADPVLGKLPVVLYSSIITEELRHKGESVGADAQLSKPEIDDMARRAIDLIE